MNFTTALVLLFGIVAASVKKAYPYPSGGESDLAARQGHRPVPPNIYKGVTPEQCNIRQHQCMTSYVYHKVNDLKLEKICTCATHIWKEGCKGFGYNDCTHVTDTYGVADAASIASGGTFNAASADTAADASAAKDTKPDLSARGLPSPPGLILSPGHPNTAAVDTALTDSTRSIENTGSKIAARKFPWMISSKEMCQENFEDCKKGWICKADPTNCDRLCNCYIGIWERICYIEHGYGVCVHGNRFQTT